MIKKTVKYTNHFDETGTSPFIEEDIYFNLTKAEAIELEVSYDGGLSAALERNKNDATEILKMIKTILLKAYGIKEGTRFIKTRELTDAFASSEAYSEIFMMMLDAEKATELINGIIPKDNISQTLIPIVEKITTA